ncbi:MAG: MarR family transcriptional regulator [Xanthomonadales bacterium]|nr:MarR family transcriptional regulator [Xanthomonadales bacterium]
MSVDQEILTALRRIIRATDLHSQELSRRCGLTGPQLVVLDCLARLDQGITVSELAESVELSQPTVTGIVNRLERRVMVNRRRSEEDRRRVLVTITDGGLEVLRAAPPRLQQQFLDQLDSMEDWEQNQILFALQRVVAMMDASGLDAAPMLVNGAITEDPNPTFPPSLTNTRHAG